MQFKYEEEAWNANYLVCGLDEAGRGSLIGPVVAAAAILKPNSYHKDLKDSKILSPKNRLLVYDWLKENAISCFSITNHREIDKYNIYQATKITMLRAIINLSKKTTTLPKLILIDAVKLDLSSTLYKNIPIISEPKGEYWSSSIAAASIIAKVERDRLIYNLANINPNYKLEKHKGYGTLEHRNNIKIYGPSFLQRKTFILK